MVVVLLAYQKLRDSSHIIMPDVVSNVMFMYIHVCVLRMRDIVSR